MQTKPKPNGGSGSFVGTSERRAHPRCRPQPFAYVKVGEHNGGIVMDASEQGLRIAAAESLAPESMANLCLQLPGSAQPVEVRGRVVWLSESKKTGGFVFASMTPEARNQIREWIEAAKNAAPASGSAPVEPLANRSIPQPGLEPFQEIFPAEGQSSSPRAGRKTAPANGNSTQAESSAPMAAASGGNGFEKLFPAEDQLPPPSHVREDSPPAMGSIGEHMPDPGPVRKVPPPIANPIGDRPPNRSIRGVAPSGGSSFGDRLPNSNYFRETPAPSLHEVRFPARAIFSDAPFRPPPIEPARWANARMGLLTGTIMVICFAAGLIAAKFSPDKWPLNRIFQAQNEGTSAPVRPLASAPAAPATASPPVAAPPAASENSVAPSASSPPVPTRQEPGEDSAADKTPNSSSKPNPSEENISAASEPSLPELGGNSILATAPAGGSAPLVVSLPQEPLTASAWVAIGVQRSAMLPPQPGPVSNHYPERIEFGKIFAQVPSVAFAANLPRVGDQVVHLRLTIGENGELREIAVVRGRAELVPVAERLVREWRQLPTLLNGRPTRSTEDVTLAFRTGR